MLACSYLVCTAILRNIFLGIGKISPKLFNSKTSSFRSKTITKNWVGLKCQNLKFGSNSLVSKPKKWIQRTFLTIQSVWYGVGYLPRQTRALGMYCRPVHSVLRRVWHICMNADVWKDKLSFERHPHVAANWHVKHTHNGSCRTRKRLVKSLTLQLFIHFWHRVS